MVYAPGYILHPIPHQWCLALSHTLIISLSIPLSRSLSTLYIPLATISNSCIVKQECMCGCRVCVHACMYACACVFVCVHAYKGSEMQMEQKKECIQWCLVCKPKQSPTTLQTPTPSSHHPLQPLGSSTHHQHPPTPTTQTPSNHQPPATSLAEGSLVQVESGTISVDVCLVAFMAAAHKPKKK